MSLYNIVNPASIVPGQPEDVSQILANFQAIQAVLNGGIDDVNIRSTAAIAPSKLAGYPADVTKHLMGDGSWKTALIPAAKAHSTADIVVANNATVALGLAGEDYDNSGMHDNVTNNNRFTIATPGIYLVTLAAILTAATAAGNNYMRLRQNGNPVADQSVPFTSTMLAQRITMAGVFKCIAGDYLDAAYFNQTTGSVTVNFATGSSVLMEVTWMGADQ